MREYVENSEGLNEFYEQLIPLLDYLLPAYVREGKAHLTIGIGCTGGRHRSVVIAEHLAERLRRTATATWSTSSTGTWTSRPGGRSARAAPPA